MTIRIVTDSTCDLPQRIVDEYQIKVIPLFIHIGSQDYRDQIDLSRQDFYEQLPSIKPAPTTAAPGPDMIRQTYDQLVAEGATEILSIHISPKLSALQTNVRDAANGFTSAAVTVFDSRQLSLGTGYQVLSAAQAAREGRSMAEIINMLEEQITRTHVFAALDTLEFLHRSGRMNFAVTAIGTFLHIKPFLEMYAGTPTASKVRTRKGAMKRLVELLNKYSPYERVALLHANAADRAQHLLQEVKALLPAGEIWLEELNPVLGAHLGPGVLGFACISKK